MMNAVLKKYSALWMACLSALMTMAQAINPGDQALGYLDRKNATVDYATGIFHYTLPLAEVKSGPYCLPVTLNYAGKGVKVADFSGATGHNWSLQTCGVITRMVRGRNDERMGYPFNFQDGRDLTAAEIDEINLHNYDCEADLFVLSLNGRSVPFWCWNISGPGVPSPIFLERTDLKISAVRGNGNVSWTVTDTDGCEYVFSAVEYQGVSYEGEMSTHNFSSSYRSSWYPVEI